MVGAGAAAAKGQCHQHGPGTVGYPSEYFVGLEGRRLVKFMHKGGCN